ncbi:MAG: DUF2142 domain-containing protein [Solirubrobacteraceae bacterium]
MWLPAAVVGVVMLSLLLWQVLKPRPYYTGSAAIGLHAIAVTVPEHQTMCTAGMHIPAGTGIVRMVVFDSQPRVSVRMSVLEAGGGSYSGVVSAPVGASTEAAVEEPIATTPSHPSSLPATICLTALSGPIGVNGMLGLQLGVPPLLVGGKPLENSVSAWFLPPHHAERSLLEQAGSVFSRAALFRPGIVGAWTYPVLLFVLLPATWLLAILLLARAAAGRPLRIRGHRIRPAAAIALITFLNAGSWALITPPFQTPDEPDHFAYVQYVAETGHAASPTPSARPPYSTDQALGLEGAHSYGVISSPEGLPPWLPLYQSLWEHARATQPHPRNNGGGFTLGAAGHAPPYYLTAAAGYELVRGESVFSQLTVVRLVSALLAAIVAACAYGIVRELLPRWRTAAIGAGLLVAFQPMFSFIGGAANNDNGVNATAAISLYLLIRALRRGLSWQIGLGLGLALGLTPLMKETGYELYPVAVVGVIALLWRYRRRLKPGPWAALVGSFVFVQGGWRLLRPVFYPAEKGIGGGGGGAISAASAVSTAEHMPLRFLEYLWELFLPRLGFMGELFPPGWPFFQVYIERGWGAFGWYILLFPRWVFLIILATMAAVAVLGLRAAWRWRAKLPSRGWELLLILLVPLCVLVAVEAAFFAPDGGRTVVAEQGRYIFPAIGALATLAVLGTFGLGRRLHVPLLTVLVVAMIALSYAGQLLTLTGFYT